LNEPLRRALLQARLREDDVAAHLGVDPKTVRRWLNGRIPYPANRAALADLLGADEADLWPNAGGPLTARTRSAELQAIYPHRSSLSHNVWHKFFSSANREIGILAHSVSFLADDPAFLGVLVARENAGVNIRIALGSPDCVHIVEGGKVEGATDAVSGKILNELTFYRTALTSKTSEIRLHHIALYHSIYFADDRLFVNQHSYCVPVAEAPVFSYRASGSSDIMSIYIHSFEKAWSAARPVHELI
jgi:transcriptional regulator with XRE-family HTH domain